MQRTVKPKTARTKRLFEKRSPKIVENPKQAVFVRGSTASAITQSILSDLFLLKKPDATNFSKKNDIHPFEDVSSLEFFAEKQDASLFVVGTHNKKRPNHLTFARMFEHKLLDMVEVGVSNYMSCSQFKNQGSTAGLRPLMTFCGPLFDMHPRYIHFKELMMDFFRGQTVDTMEIDGLQHVICISAGEQTHDPSSTKEDLPPILFRVYVVGSRKVAGSKVPKIELEEMGPRMDLKFGRWQEPNEEMMTMALKKPKPTIVKTKKNVEIDTMGDKLGRIHVGVQDLRKLQTRKVKGLKRRAGESDDEGPKKQRITSKKVSALEEGESAS